MTPIMPERDIEICGVKLSQWPLDELRALPWHFFFFDSKEHVAIAMKYIEDTRSC